ncbi:hypothetical protein L218DRAFT_1073495 [Marasmius fiardii PR-910]|nr:hypothetical protein L218DRAFT_1073495 [Marasmius fiardii PR-910]
MADDDQVNTETLQAQIDLSMSLMHGLVSSWIQSTSQPLPRSNDSIIENEMRESMRKPPRLGVGASIPDANQSSSRNAARLKGQLVGKRKRDESDFLIRPSQNRGQLSDEDDEESRCGAIKKKAKSDPFFTKVSRPQSQSTRLLSSIDRETRPSLDSGNVKAIVEKPNSTEITGAKSTDMKDEEIPHSDSGSKLVVLSRSEKGPQRPEVHTPVSPINRVSRPSPPTPLLNLDGPVADQNSEEDEIPEAQPLSPSKRRRKRRKKKKSFQVQTTS